MGHQIRYNTIGYNRSGYINTFVQNHNAGADPGYEERVWTASKHFFAYLGHFRGLFKYPPPPAPPHPPGSATAMSSPFTTHRVSRIWLNHRS